MIEDIDIGMICDGAKGKTNKCTSQAIYAVTVHYIDYCKTSVRVNPQGDRAFLLCGECTALMTERATELLRNCGFTLKTPGECKACSKTIGALHDLITIERAVGHAHI